MIGLLADRAGDPGSDWPTTCCRGSKRSGKRPSGAATQRLGRYELGELLGTGSFGAVWRGVDTKLGREVAVKVLGGQPGGLADKERFLREARSAAQLRHPGIVAVYDVGEDRDTLYIVLELVRGANLMETMKAGKLRSADAVALVARVADALDYAHRNGVVHRDIKPSNIMMEPAEGEAGPGRPRITDFGLALRSAAEATLTHDDQILGTPAYMSPEQVRDAHAVDGRSDLYSLGVILYELLTGELPFTGPCRSLLLRVMSDEPRSPRRIDPAIPPELETICLRCLAKDPEGRYPTAGALVADLRRWHAGDPIQARPPGLAERGWRAARSKPTLAAAALLAAVGLAAALFAPASAAMLALAIGAMMFGLHKARVASDLAHALDIAGREHQKTEAAFHFAHRHHALACQERDRAVAAVGLASSRAALARAFLVQTVLPCLDLLARQAGGHASLRRRLATAYARAGEMLAALDPEGRDAAALAGRRRCRESLAMLEPEPPPK